MGLHGASGAGKPEETWRLAQCVLFFHVPTVKSDWEIYGTFFFLRQDHLLPFSEEMLAAFEADARAAACDLYKPHQWLPGQRLEEAGQAAWLWGFP